MNSKNLWYAYQIDADDNDWGTGTYDENEATKWLEENPKGRVAVIEEGDDPVCVDEWYGEEFEGYRHP